MSKLCFVRHGESEANVLKVMSNRGSVHGLTEKGRRQAAELALALEATGATRVYSSPLLRARETAEILADVFGLGYEVADALREFDCGIAEGRSDPGGWGLYWQVVDKWVQDGQLDARIEGGESLVDIQNRFVPFVEGILEEQEDGDVSILVGHGGVYRLMLPLVLVNVGQGADLFLPNAAYVLAEARSDGLVCLEWCGKPSGHLE